MATALALQSEPLAIELFQLLRDLDPSRWRASVEASARIRIAQLGERLDEVIHALPDAPSATSIRESWQSIAELLRENVPGSDLSAAEVAAHWKTFTSELQVEYERLSLTLRESSVRVPSLRPTNYVRNIWHVSSSLFAVFLVEAVLTEKLLWIVPLAVASFFWFLEGLRAVSDRVGVLLMRILGPIAHPHEAYRVNSSTFFATGLTVLGLSFEPRVIAVAVTVLGVGDPAAALIGRRWGKTKLAGQRTLEGTLAFVAASMLATLVVLRLGHGEMSAPAMLLVAAGAALPAAVVELYSSRIDDNLSIPLTAAAGAWLATLFI